MLAAQVGDRLGQVGDGDGPHAGEGRLRRRLGRADEALDAEPARAFRDREHAANAAQPAVERKLADRCVPAQLRLRDLPRRGEHGERDRQVVAGAFLPQSGRREVDGDAPARKLELGGDDPAAHARARLGARAIGQADNRERRQAVVVHVRLHLDAAWVEPHEGVGDRACEQPTAPGYRRG